MKLVKSACALCGALGMFFGAQAQQAPAAPAQTETVVEEVDTGFSFTPGEGISFGETPIVSAEFSLKFDSKYMSYGLVDNRDPILTPTASATFFDWVTFEVMAIFDMTKYGRKRIDGERIYANRGGRYTELDPSVYIGHSFSPDDYSWLPTTVEFTLGYMYEYHSDSMGDVWSEHSQFVWADIALPDLWIEPYFYYERDIDRDNGTYLQVEVGHTFALIDGEGEDDDPVLAFRPSVSQGFGNGPRVNYYLEIDHAGLMDTCLKGELTWTISSWLSLSGYVAYYDFLFDERIRESARGYTQRNCADESWNFVTGLALTATF